MSGSSISNLTAAASVNLTDLLGVTQGSTGPGTGVTKKATITQVLSLISVPTQLLQLTGDVNIATPLNTQILSYNSGTSKWQNVYAPYDLGGFFPGLPQNAQPIGRYQMVRTVVFPANFVGSYASCLVAPTASAVINIKNNGAAVGTLTFAASATTGTFASSGAQTITAGTFLELDAPSPQDSTFSGPNWTLVGSRTS